MAFSASEAAVEGFRIARREPRTILGWSLFQLVFAIAMTAATLPFMRPLAALQSLQTPGARPTTAQLSAVLEPVLGFLGAVIPLELVLFSVLGAAVFRAVLRPHEKGLARLKLGGDELRMAILWIELGFLLWVVGAVVMVSVAIVASVIVTVLKAPIGEGLVTAAVCYLAVLAVMVWLSVRLSLAAPLTFATRKVQLFAAWKLTRGRFWPLFGCYLLSFIFMAIVMFAMLSVVALVALALSGGSMPLAAKSLGDPDYASFAAYLTPVRIIQLLLNALAGGLYWGVAFAPAAVAYREFGNVPA